MRAINVRLWSCWSSLLPFIMFASHSREFEDHVQFMARLQHTPLLTEHCRVHSVLLSITWGACERTQNVPVSRIHHAAYFAAVLLLSHLTFVVLSGHQLQLDLFQFCKWISWVWWCCRCRRALEASSLLRLFTSLCEIRTEFIDRSDALLLLRWR